MSTPKDFPTLIRESGLFDAQWYVDTYPDVLATGLEPLEHFVKIGSSLKRDPGTGFSARKYLEANQDVAEAGIEPLQHYLNSLARGEKVRPIFPSYARMPNLAKNPDVEMHERLEKLEIENEILTLELSRAKAKLDQVNL